MCAKLQGSIASINEDIRGGAQSTPSQVSDCQKTSGWLGLIICEDLEGEISNDTFGLQAH